MCPPGYASTLFWAKAFSFRPRCAARSGGISMPVAGGESSPLRSQAPFSRDDALRLSVRDFLSRWQISGQVAAIIAIKFAAPYEPADEQASDASIADRRAETQHEDAPAAAAAAVTTAPIR